MQVPSSVAQALAILVLIVPGFVFQAVRIRLRGLPPRDTEIASRILTAIAVSMAFDLLYAVALGGKVASVMHDPGHVLAHPRGYAALGVAAAFVIPAVAANIAVWSSGWKWLYWCFELLTPPGSSRIDTRPSGWDVAFQAAEPCFVRVRTSDGTWYAGWFGENSYASSWPDPRSLFVEVSWQIDEDGMLGEQVVGSVGAVIDCTDAQLVELLRSPGEAGSGTLVAEEEPA